MVIWQKGIAFVPTLATRAALRPAVRRSWRAAWGARMETLTAAAFMVAALVEEEGVCVGGTMRCPDVVPFADKTGPTKCVSTCSDFCAPEIQKLTHL